MLRAIFATAVLCFAATVLADQSPEEEIQAARDLVAKLQAEADANRPRRGGEPEIKTEGGSVKLVVDDGKHVAINIGGEAINIDELDTNMKALDAKALTASSSAMLLGYNLGVDSKDTRQLIKAKELDIINGKIQDANGVQANLSKSQAEIEVALYTDLAKLKESIDIIKDTLRAPGPPQCKVGVEYQTKAGDAETPPECSYISTGDCPPGSFESKRPSRTSDRTCKEHTKCGTNEYRSSPGTALSDSICEDVKVCKSNEEQVKAPTADSDRICGAKGASGGSCSAVGTGMAGDVFCVKGKSVGGDGTDKSKAAKSCFTIRHGHGIQKDGTYWCYFNEAADKAFKVFCDMRACSRDASGEWDKSNVDKDGCGGWTLALKSQGTPDSCLNKKDNRWRSDAVMGSTENLNRQCAKGPAYSKAPFTDVMIRSLADYRANVAWRHTVAGKSLHNIIGQCQRKHDGELIVPGYIQATHNQKLTALLHLDWYRKNELNNHEGDRPRPSGLWHSTCTGGQRFGFFVQDYDGGHNVAGCQHRSGGGGGVIGVGNYNWYRSYTYEQYGDTTRCISAYAFGGGYECACEGGTTSYQSHSTMGGHWWGHGGHGMWANAHGIFVRDIRDVPGKSLTKRHGTGVYTGIGGGHHCTGCRN
jgi:hypothetical protein